MSFVCDSFSGFIFILWFKPVDPECSVIHSFGVLPGGLIDPHPRTDVPRTLWGKSVYSWGRNPSFDSLSGSLD